MKHRCDLRFNPATLTYCWERKGCIGREHKAAVYVSHRYRSFRLKRPFPDLRMRWPHLKWENRLGLIQLLIKAVMLCQSLFLIQLWCLQGHRLILTHTAECTSLHTNPNYLVLWVLIGLLMSPSQTLLYIFTAPNATEEPHLTESTIKIYTSHCRNRCYSRDCTHRQ